MNDDELLASVMRKLIHQAHHARDGAYLDTSMDGSLVIDGWTSGITAEEMQAMRRVSDAERASAEAEYRKGTE